MNTHPTYGRPPYPRHATPRTPCCNAGIARRVEVPTCSYHVRLFNLTCRKCKTVYTLHVRPCKPIAIAKPGTKGLVKVWSLNITWESLS